MIGMPILTLGSVSLFSLTCRPRQRPHSPTYIPFLKTSHVEWPPKLLPAQIHCETVRSPSGKRYEGKKSIRNDTSCAVPAEKDVYVSFSHQHFQGRVCGALKSDVDCQQRSLWMAYMSNLQSACQVRRSAWQVGKVTI